MMALPFRNTNTEVENQDFQALHRIQIMNVPFPPISLLNIEKVLYKSGEHGFNLDFLEVMEDDEYTIDVLQTFLQQTPVELDQLYDAAGLNNHKEIAAHAHKLKGCIGLFQISDMLILLNSIEQNAQIKNGYSLEKVTTLIKIYRGVEHHLMQHLQILMKKSPVMDKNVANENGPLMAKARHKKGTA